MNTTKQFFDQQYGFARWKFYENIIQRLRCSKDEQYTQLLPHNEPGICDTPIFACKFAQKESHQDLIALANEDGKLAIHDTSNKTERYGGVAHNNAIFDLAWMFNNMKIVTASGDHTATLFDVSESDVRKIKSFYGHTRSVKTVAFRKDDPSVFATGGRDGNIIIWDTRTEIGDFIGRPDRTIANSHVLNNCAKTSTPTSRKKRFATLTGTKSVTGLAFQDDNTLISCGAGDGIIKVWDLRRNYCNHKHTVLSKAIIPYSGSKGKNGFSSLIIDKEATKLYANCLDNTIYSYNLNTYNPEPLMKYTGHQNSTFYIKSCLSRDGYYLISGSSDESAYVWNINQPKPIVRLSGHCAEVTCVAWCERTDDTTIVTCSDDMSHRIWRVGHEDLPDNWEIIGRGKAEILPNLNTPKSKLKRSSLSETPQSCKKMTLVCDNCGNRTPTNANFCVDCRNSNKRKCLEEISNESKRVNRELSPKRLFEDENETELTCVLDLPNFVVDGVAPHLIFSPPKKKAQDWLTKLRIERHLLKKDIFDAPQSPKIAKLDTSGCVKKSSSQQSPILRYFKVKCEGHGSKSLGCGVPIASPKSSQQ